MGKLILRFLNYSCIFIVFMVASTKLYGSGSDFFIGTTVGLRKSHTARQALTFGINGGYENLAFDFRLQGLEEVNTTLSYDFDAGKTLHNEFLIHSLYVPKEGGFSDLSYIFSQEFEWKYFYLFYGIGVQIALAYTPYSEEYLWSLSPLVKGGFEFILYPFSFGFSIGLNNRIERSWKAVPVYDVYMDIRIDESKIRISGFARQAEYLVDPWIMITAYGLSISYVYGGN